MRSSSSQCRVRWGAERLEAGHLVSARRLFVALVLTELGCKSLPATPVELVAPSRTSTMAAHFGELVWSKGDEHNVGPDIVTLSNPAEVTHSLTASLGGKSATLGFAAHGGGYINSLVLRGFPSVRGRIVIADFGKGWQGSIRDALHKRFYNPTQAGATNTLGAPVEILEGDKSITVPQFRLPLFTSPLSTSTRRSDFDFSARTTDVSEKYGVLAFDHQEYYAFVGDPPDSLREFANVILENERLDDISDALAGSQTPTNDDLSRALHVIMGLRVSSSFKWFHYRSGGKWATRPAEGSRYRGLFCALPYSASERLAAQDSHARDSTKGECQADLALGILSSEEDPNAGVGIGLYVPFDSPLNKASVRTISRATLEELRREDRRIRPYLTQELRLGFVSVRVRDQIAGLLSPASATKANGEPSFEVLTNQSVFLFGTPEEIFRAVQNQPYQY